VSRSPRNVDQSVEDSDFDLVTIVRSVLFLESGPLDQFLMRGLIACARSEPAAVVPESSRALLRRSQTSGPFSDASRTIKPAVVPFPGGAQRDCQAD
jgi:hypothetical protein